MPRITVRKMLKKRLAESKRGLKAQVQYEDLTNVMGGQWNPEVEKQFTKNMEKDIEEIEYLLKCLDEKK